MKLHAAALVLVLWYLMVPPSNGSPTFLFDAHVPLNQWTVRDTFDMATECRQQARTTASLFKAFAKKDATVAAINNSKRFAMAICLETTPAWRRFIHCPSGGRCPERN